METARSESYEEVAFQYLTTSEPGFELGSPFGTGVRGIEFWERCKRHPEGVESIRAFLLKRDDLDKDLRLFLENATLDQVYDDLVQPIAWITGRRDTHDLQNAISDILIVHGEQSGCYPQHRKRLGQGCFKKFATPSPDRELKIVYSLVQTF